MLSIQSSTPLTLIQPGGIPLCVIYEARAGREVSHGGHVDEYVGTVHVSLADGSDEAFPCQFRFQRSLTDVFLPERLVEQAIRGHVAVNPAFRAWLRHLSHN